MKSSTLVRWMIVCVTVALLPSQIAHDTIQLQCALSPACPAGENGILLISGVNALAFPPSSDAAIPVGQVPSDYHEAVAFRSDRSPAIQTTLNWTTAPDTATLTYPSAIEVPLQVWVICAHHKAGKPDCSAFDSTVTRVKAFLANANHVLERERVGIRLIGAAPGDTWITNIIGNPALAEFVDFSQIQCASLDVVLSAAGSTLRNNSALNMYLVETVDNEPGYGYTCNIPRPPFTVTGDTASWRTMLHEVGHTLSLDHVEPTDPWKYSRPKNYMYAYSSVRQFFSEGQSFIARFRSKSILNNPLGLGTDSRDCDDPSKPPCPPVGTWIWPDK